MENPLSYSIDSLDLKILSLLKKNARMKYVEISTHTGISEAAVRYRVKKLLEKNIIKRFTIDTVMDEPGAIVLLRIDTLKSPSTLKKLKSLFGTMYELSGEWDAAVLIKANDSYELNHMVDRIRNVAGVIETQTLLKMT